MTLTADMTDRELVGYVDLHSRTERALFHVSMVQRFFALARTDVMIVPGEEIPLRYVDIQPYLGDAYEALKGET